MTARQPNNSIKSLKGTPADKAPNIPRHNAIPVTTVKWFGLNQRVDNFKIETQATPIDAPMMSLPKLAMYMEEAKAKKKAPKLDKSVPTVSSFLGPQ
jgi:hypothetical protein